MTLWKMHLTMKPKFMLSTDSNEKRKMSSKSNSSIVMIGKDTDEFLQELPDSFLHKYQISLEQSVKSSNFIFEYVSGKHYICNKVNINRGGSYIYSPKWIKR